MVVTPTLAQRIAQAQDLIAYYQQEIRKLQGFIRMLADLQDAA